MRAAATLACLVAATSVAAADDEPSAPAPAGLYERLWPRVPEGTRLTLSLQLQDGLSELGNTLGYHLDLLSRDMVSLRVDARRRRAYVRLGGGDAQHLAFRLASDVHFTAGLARIATRVDLGLAGRTLHLELPEVEMTPTEFQGERGLVVRLPLLRRNF